MSMRFRVWLNFIFPVFRPLEKAILNAWIAHLDEETRRIVQSQLRLVNYVQRHDRGREVCMYWRKSGVTRIDFPELLPFAAREFKMANMKFQAGKEPPSQVEVWAVNGHIFSLDFDKSPRRIINQKVIDIIELDLHPQQETGPNTSQLPEDYLEIIESGIDQAGLVPAMVLPLAEIYPLKFEAGKFYALAEVPDFGIMAVKDGDATKQVYFLAYDGAKPRPVSTSFREAVRTMTAEYAKTL